MKQEMEYTDYIDDMISSIQDCENFIKGMDYEKFFKDRKTTMAVVRALEVLGEAAKHIPREIRDKHYDIPWKKITGLRDTIAHDYFGIDLKIVWKIVKEDLPSVKPFIKKIL